MNIAMVVLLALAVIVLIGAEWPRLEQRFGLDARQRRARDRRKANLRLVKPDHDEPADADEFAASVERDLANLPTTGERDRNGR